MDEVELSTLSTFHIKQAVLPQLRFWFWFCILRCCKEHFMSYRMSSTRSLVTGLSRGTEGHRPACCLTGELISTDLSDTLPQSKILPSRSQRSAWDPAHISAVRHCMYSHKHLMSVLILQLWSSCTRTMFSSAAPYKNQHYADLRKHCIEDKTLFEDPEFPANNSSLYFRKPPPGRVEWKRPGVSDFLFLQELSPQMHYHT